MLRFGDLWSFIKKIKIRDWIQNFEYNKNYSINCSFFLKLLCIINNIIVFNVNTWMFTEIMLVIDKARVINVRIF